VFALTAAVLSFLMRRIAPSREAATANTGPSR
jgi:hypothetical protein